MDQRFFGFDPAYQILLHEQLFDLVWYGDGRWDWDTVYNLPVHIKRLWIKKYNQIKNPEPSEQQLAEQRAAQLAEQSKSKI